MYAFLNSLLYHWSRFRNTGTLDNLVGIQDLFFCVLTFFPFNMAVIEHLFVFIGNLRHVGYEHIKAFFLGKNSCTSTALSCS